MAGRKISARKCAVYGKGLSRSAALVLAKQHNEINNIQRSTTFPEVAACCRRLLFTHFGDGADDDGVTHPTIPHYNSQSYRAFKQECLTFLMSSQTVCVYNVIEFCDLDFASESGNDRAGNPDGTSQREYLLQDAGGLH